MPVMFKNSLLLQFVDKAVDAKKNEKFHNSEMQKEKDKN